MEGLKNSLYHQVLAANSSNFKNIHVFMTYPNTIFES